MTALASNPLFRAFSASTFALDESWAAGPGFYISRLALVGTSLLSLTAHEHIFQQPHGEAAINSDVKQQA
jgi:hypothetical protein